MLERALRARPAVTLPLLREIAPMRAATSASVTSVMVVAWRGRKWWPVRYEAVARYEAGRRVPILTFR